MQDVGSIPNITEDSQRTEAVIEPAHEFPGGKFACCTVRRLQCMAAEGVRSVGHGNFASSVGISGRCACGCQSHAAGCSTPTCMLVRLRETTASQADQTPEKTKAPRVLSGGKSDAERAQPCMPKYLFEQAA